jgi:hypothetical protein
MYQNSRILNVVAGGTYCTTRLRKINSLLKVYDIMSKQFNYSALFVLERSTFEETALKYMRVLIKRKTNKYKQLESKSPSSSSDVVHTPVLT